MTRGSKTTAPEIPRASDGKEGPRVLVVDDDELVTKSHAQVLRRVASSVVTTTSSKDALARLRSDPYDVVVADIHMPELDGTALLQAVRERDLDLPVIFVTGGPTLESATRAIELGAFRYLTKPVETDELRKVVLDAARSRALSRAKSGVTPRADLERAFRSAIARLRMAYQPIVAAETRVTTAFEALMRSDEPQLPNPPAVLDAAEKLGALHLLGRHVRNLVASDMDGEAAPPQVFVNLHSADLADPQLYDPAAPLSRHARRVVLEITERASLESVSDLDARREQLRRLGYRLAVDDLGAGYAGLSYFARLSPDIVKIDMSLVRDVDTAPVKQQVVVTLLMLAGSFGMEVVAEGVETKAERDTVVSMGCTYVQGYFLGKPRPGFEPGTWS
jgi:EAL domain-containing protein (putative c-di-GMP-specific phosphodiesterase class I)